MIYRHADFPFGRRPRDHCLRLSLFYQVGQPAARVVHSDFTAPSSHTETASHRRTKHKRQNESQSGAAILRGSKQLHSEAAELLYGESQFFILSSAALGEFVDVIGATRRHLRHLGIEGYFDTSTSVPGLLVCSSRQKVYGASS